ncbi:MULTISPECIES: DUF5667 domain-containing protein [Streptomyces]|uniref:DUF5667 domain-containing protein n=1 Tax=Streptomyces TaxID=1883 RepID=UPI002248D684|nr:DUF5667 domain-containing protein [Streptomyces sp. JHD 1]MCX2968931.1 DUF5667 domain-containing protein [Streptomyces sp. JHD 1]
MIGSVSTTRRANAFAQALDERASATAGDTADAAPPPDAAPPGAHRAPSPGGAADEAERGVLLALTEDLAALPAPELDPEVKAVQRAQLIAAMETQFAHGGAAVPEQRGRSRKGAHRATAPLGRIRPRTRLGKGLAAGGLTVGVAAGALSGVAAASTDALPGDTLYGLKRGMEDLKLDLAGDDAERGVVHLDHASTRLNEARRLLERDRAGALDHQSLTEVRGALTAMRVNAAEGHRLLSGVYERDGSLGPMRSLSAFAQSHRTTWAQLRDRLPAQLHDVSDEVTSVFDAISDDVEPIEDLLPSTEPRTAPPGSAGPGSDDGTGAGRDGAPSSPRGDAGPGSGPASPPVEERSPDGREAPSPSTPGGDGGEPEDGGLLGGPGLLDPPRTGAPGDGERPGPSGLPTPDITIPPLLPGGLPGLGLDVGEE